MKKKEVSATLNVSDLSDPQKFPWPVKPNSIKELTCVNVFEYIPGRFRGKFMDEIHRVLVKGGTATFAVRYWNTDSAIQDYAYEWPPVCEKSFLYFNKGWREVNGIKRDLACDFDFTYGYSVEPETAAKNDETRSFHIKRYSNVVQVLQVLLTKR